MIGDLVSEFECPVCGVDQDVEPALKIGETHRAICCGREFVVDDTNTQTYRVTGDLVEFVQTPK